ncbi:hypothetical protein BKA64DRAFT_710837 [Cadophora sp. MPI-SDFR-AT-0126]|nr:hypothetical protein BKA64DRAFT_710837 [Leotiomycetes sp. MPI-SDFR-AT-0126]
MFAFVDALNNTYSTKAIRSHVMTNAYREKKKLQKDSKSKKFKSLQPRTWVLEVHSDSPAPASIGLESDHTGTTSSDVSTPNSDHSSVTISSYQALWAELSTHPSLQPRTIIPAGHVDHFSTPPVPRTPIIDEFVSAYLGPPIDYGIGRRPSMAFNYRRARFKASLSDECSFYAMLSWLSRRARMVGDWRAMLHSMHFKGKCIRILTERLKEGKEVDEGMVYGALDLSNAEA